MCTPCYYVSHFHMKNCKIFLGCNVSLAELQCPLLDAVTDGFKFQRLTCTVQGRVYKACPRH